ncbi:MAG: hypothetical protein N2V78_09075 [Methanophagales archaeon]|nr:hypothetical protein [Methanophagales archaeon]
MEHVERSKEITKSDIFETPEILEDVRKKHLPFSGGDEVLAWSKEAAIEWVRKLKKDYKLDSSVIPFEVYINKEGRLTALIEKISINDAERIGLAMVTWIMYFFGIKKEEVIKC